MKKTFTFQTPYTICGVCKGNYEISGTAYNAELYDIDSVTWVGLDMKRSALPILALEGLNSHELPELIHEATCEHLKYLYSGECEDTTTDMSQDFPPLHTFFKDFGQIFNPNTNAA